MLSESQVERGVHCNSPFPKNGQNSSVVVEIKVVITWDGVGSL